MRAHLIKLHEALAAHHARASGFHKNCADALDADDPHAEFHRAMAAERDEMAEFHRAAGGSLAEMPEREQVPRGHGPGEKAEFDELLKGVVGAHLGASGGDADRTIRSLDLQMRRVLGVDE
jgi:hypothetical protein